MNEQLEPHNSGSRARKLIIPAAFVAALVGGGVAVTAFGPSASAAVQSDDTTTTESSDPAASTDESTPADGSSGTSDSGASGAAEERDGECGPGGRRGPHGHRLGRFAGLSVAAEALGVEEDELRESLRDGDSIADVAGEQGVDVQTVIDALIAAATERIDERVAAGELDEERAAELEERLGEWVTAKVTGEIGVRSRPGRQGEERPADLPPIDESGS